MPCRSFESPQEFVSHLEDAEELIFDGTENLTQRPQDNDKQRSKYSGKKGTHTDVALVLCDKATRIYYVSNYYDGKHVDMGILKAEFPPDKDWFSNFKVLFDLGFVGVDKLYQFKELILGEKKPRKSKSNPKPELSASQKFKNRLVSKERIFVEL